MPTKTTKSKVSKSATKRASFKFRWWMGLALVAAVAIVGVLVLRFSQAGAAALVGGNSSNPCTARVNLTHNYSKGTSQVANVCMKRGGKGKDLNSLVQTDVNLNPGKPANYCVWGRYQAATAKATNINLQLVNGTKIVGESSSWVAGPLNEVTGYGDQFSTAGGNHKLICTYTSSPNITGFYLWTDSYDYPYTAYDTPGASGPSHIVENIMFYDNVSIE